MRACANGQVDVVHALVEANADLSAHNKVRINHLSKLRYWTSSQSDNAVFKKSTSPLLGNESTNDHLAVVVARSMVLYMQYSGLMFNIIIPIPAVLDISVIGQYVGTH